MTPLAGHPPTPASLNSHRPSTLISPSAEAVGDRSRYVRRPAVMALLAFAIGIVLDRGLSPTGAFWLAALGLLVGLLWCGRARWERFPGAASAACLLCCLSAGGLRYHEVRSVRAEHDIGTYCQEAAVPVRLRGIVSTPIEIQQAKYGPRIPSWMEIDRSQCEFRCEGLLVDGAWTPVSGTLSLTVDGHLVHVGVGDRVDVLGFLSAASAPGNPGEPDYRLALKNRGISGLLRVDHPQAVTRRERLQGTFWRLARLRDRIRRAAHRHLFEGLSPATRGIAASLLIGDRTLMTDDLREHFVESGTMHLLAISGLHVGILLGIAGVLCKLCNLSDRSTAVLLVLLALAYAALTNHRAPVLRATLLATLVLTGGIRGRPLDGINLLGVTGLLLLLWNPGDLFDIGAQLSFLAVAGILWGMKAFPASNPFEEPDPLAPERSRLFEGIRAVGRGLGGAYLVTGAIWLVTTPLTLHAFHVFAPVGVLMNIVLIPFTSAILGLGYLFLGTCVVLPIVSSPFAWLFDCSLRLFLEAVRLGQATPWGHFHLPDIPPWWMAGFHLLIAVIWLGWGVTPHLRWTFHALLAWMALGLLACPGEPRRETLRCTFLAMGHGLSTIVEFPGGRTLLYDAGTIGDGTRAERIIERALWSRGISRLDAILISHADHDHYSGAFGLLEKFPVGRILIGQASLAATQQGIADLTEIASGFGVPIRIVQEGDRLPTVPSDPEATLSILHPHGSFRSKADNANSVVLEIAFRGKRILLTGDLEKDGLARLLASPARKCDVLLAPHHGGKAANVPELYAWANPDVVVVSSRGEEPNSELGALIGSAELLVTDTSGAITVEIDLNGTLSVTEFRRPASR